jgi:hypothetical protein
VRRVILTLLTLAVLLPSSAFARTNFLCSMDGQVRSSCCCPAKTKKHEAPPVSMIRAQCCCKITTVAATSQPPATHEAKAVPLPPVVAIITTVPSLASRVERATIAPRALAPPDPDRSLFVRHCALLL